MDLSHQCIDRAIFAARNAHHYNTDTNTVEIVPFSVGLMRDQQLEAIGELLKCVLDEPSSLEDTSFERFSAAPLGLRQAFVADVLHALEVVARGEDIEKIPNTIESWLKNLDD